ncbi:MAG TPA: TonB family protein, partial [Puia sp.]|nr:TonB family protein [Puia sp.]
NLRVPKDVLETGQKVKVVVKFVVDKEGIVRDFEVMEHGGNDFDEEVLRVMKKMPHWKPGMQNGRNVAVYYYLPVTFQGPDEN